MVFNLRPQTKPCRSLLSTENWRYIERLLQQTVSDIYDKKIQKLSSTIYSLSTENILLKLRCSGLEKALKNKQKKYQRKKPFLFDLRTSEGGNTIFYLSNKIQETQDLQAQKNKAIQLNKAAKQNRKLCRKQKKKEKQLLLEKRKRNRALNKKIYQQTNVRKQYQKKKKKFTKKTNLQLQNNINQAAKGKNKISISSTPKNMKNTSDQNKVVVAEVSYSINCRGRQIRLPVRFQNL